MATAKYMRMVTEARKLISEGKKLDEVVAAMRLPRNKYSYVNGRMYIRGGLLGNLHVGAVSK